MKFQSVFLKEYGRLHLLATDSLRLCKMLFIRPQPTSTLAQPTLTTVLGNHRGAGCAGLEHICISIATNRVADFVGALPQVQGRSIHLHAKFFFLTIFLLLLCMGLPKAAYAQKASTQNNDLQAPSGNDNIYSDKLPNWVLDYDTPYGPQGEPTLFPKSKPTPQKYIDLIKSRVTNVLLDQKVNLPTQHLGKVTWELDEVSYLQVDNTTFLAALWRTKERINQDFGYGKLPYFVTQYLVSHGENITYEALDGSHVPRGQSNIFTFLIEKAHPRKANLDYLPPHYRLPVWLVIKSDGKRSVLTESYESHEWSTPSLRIFSTTGTLTGHLAAIRGSDMQFTYFPSTGKIVLTSFDNFKTLFPAEKNEYEISVDAAKAISSYSQGADALKALGCEFKLIEKLWRCKNSNSFEGLLFRAYAIDDASNLKLLYGKSYARHLSVSAVTDGFHRLNATLQRVADTQAKLELPPSIYQSIRVFSVLETLEDPITISETYQKIPEKIRSTLQPRAFALLLAALGRPALLPVFDKP